MNNARHFGVPIALSMGANLGDRLSALKYAIKRMSEIIPDIASSNVYETEPIGYTDQPAFLNCACIGHTESSIDEVLNLIHVIHAELHRKARPKWHEREIDIDILLFGDIIIETDQISIPHPRMHERAFVLKPLSEIAPGILHPKKERTISELLVMCNDDSEIVIHTKSEEL
jgi:2-amino-4-hydroxy-6-hydroxymethyldihydropteridine diphosphokinase